MTPHPPYASRSLKGEGGGKDDLEPHEMDPGGVTWILPRLSPFFFSNPSHHQAAGLEKPHRDMISLPGLQGTGSTVPSTPLSQTHMHVHTHISRVQLSDLFFPAALGIREDAFQK